MSGGYFDRPGPQRLPWLAGTGGAADVVVATRARLSRNLHGLPFPGRASETTLRTVADDLERHLAEAPALAGGWRLEPGSAEGDLVDAVLRESQLLGAATPGTAHRRLFVGPDGGTVAVVNEEDHLRLKAFRPGLDAAGAAGAVLELDERVAPGYAAAFAEDLGYLTASPADVGTGLRLTAVLHLPGLVMADEIDKVLNALRHLQFVVTGLHSAGRAVRGAFFQVANVITLGRTEEEMVEDFAAHMTKIVGYERAARDLLRDRDVAALEDLVHRAAGVLAGARLLSSQEAMDCLSHVRLGAAVGLLPPLTPAAQALLTTHRAGHLGLAAGRTLEAREKLTARADLVREVFAA